MKLRMRIKIIFIVLIEFFNILGFGWMVQTYLTFWSSLNSKPLSRSFTSRGVKCKSISSLGGFRSFFSYLRMQTTLFSGSILSSTQGLQFAQIIARLFHHFRGQLTMYANGHALGVLKSVGHGSVTTVAAHDVSVFVVFDYGRLNI